MELRRFYSSELISSSSGVFPKSACWQTPPFAGGRKKKALRLESAPDAAFIGSFHSQKEGMEEEKEAHCAVKRNKSSFSRFPVLLELKTEVPQ